MQFNTSGNLALEKSILNDEATMLNLVLQFEEFSESLLKIFNKNPKRLQYQVQMLPTTIYNYKDLSKLYKEQTQIGFSKLLPQVALGESPSVVLATAIFENQIMNLDEVFIPPQMSSTISKAQQSGRANGQEDTNASAGEEGGRPELPQDEKSDKTIANEECEGLIERRKEMALKNKSEIDMIQGPEFINLQPLDINPLMKNVKSKFFI